MSNYMYFADITSVFFIIILLGNLMESIVSSIISWSDMGARQEKTLKEKLKNLHAKIKGSEKFLSVRKLLKAMRYTEECENLSSVSTTLSGCLFSTATILGLGPLVFHTTELHTGSILISTITVMIFQLLLNTVISLPFSHYQTFTIEKKYNFNKTTKATFLLDIIKSVLLSATFTASFATGLFYVLEYLSPLTCGTAVCMIAISVIFGFVMETIGTFSMCLFNKFEPLKDKNLERSLKNLFKSQGKTIRDVCVMNESLRSNHSNAFVCGFGPFRRVVLFDTLLKNKFTTREITAIMAHELAHMKLNHLSFQRLLGYAKTSVFIFLSVLLYDNTGLFHAFGFNWINEANVHQYSIIGLGLSAIIMGVFNSLVISPIENAISRKMELAADRAAVKYMPNKNGGKDLANALIKLHSENLAEIFPSRTSEMLTYDHPSLENRLKNISNTLKK